MNKPPLLKPEFVCTHFEIERQENPMIRLFLLLTWLGFTTFNAMERFAAYIHDGKTWDLVGATLNIMCAVMAAIVINQQRD